MSRLVTFGCSYTLGDGLPDIYKKPSDSNYIASSLSYTSILANKLNLTLENNAVSGSGNKEILIKILNTELERSDLVLVAWTHFTRHDFFLLNNVNSGSRTTIKSRIKNILTGYDYEDREWLQDLHYKNWLTIHHADLYLKDLSINAFHFIMSEDHKKHPIPILYQVRNFLDITLNDFFIDKAADQSHPGVESNKLLANLLYNKIIQHELR